MPGFAGSANATAARIGTTTPCRTAVFYMAPDLADRLEIEVDGNGFRGELSADAAGIVATLFALGQLAAEAADTDAGDALIDRYHFLRGFAASHAEAGRDLPGY
jgi:hypothetical protein